MHSSTRDLWFEITKLFREGNSLIIYHLHKRISLIGQDNAFVLVHFFKLKILWDGLRSIETLSPCIYGDLLVFSDNDNFMWRITLFRRGRVLIKSQVLKCPSLPFLGSRIGLLDHCHMALLYGDSSRSTLSDYCVTLEAPTGLRFFIFDGDSCLYNLGHMANLDGFFPVFVTSHAPTH